jgi:hypothetical protein
MRRTQTIEVGQNEKHQWMSDINQSHRIHLTTTTTTPDSGAAEWTTE